MLRHRVLIAALASGIGLAAFSMQASARDEPVVGAVGGAVAGGLVAGPPGAVAGAVIGGVSGAIVADDKARHASRYRRGYVRYGSSAHVVYNGNGTVTYHCDTSGASYTTMYRDDHARAVDIARARRVCAA